VICWPPAMLWLKFDRRSEASDTTTDEVYLARCDRSLNETAKQLG
jgi:hypothetical protein